MTVAKSFLSGFLFVLALGFPASATSLVSVSATVNDTICNQSNPNSAICDISVPIVPGYLDAVRSEATATWALNGSGTLEAQVRSYGSTTRTGASGTADVSFSNLLIVTGATGSGTLQILFSGYQASGVVPGDPGQAAVSPVGVSLGSFSTSAALPHGFQPQAFSVTAPLTFNSPTLFSVAFGANASGGFGSDCCNYASRADGILQFPTFVVTDSSGNVLRNASVQFVPEPATWFFVVLGLALLPLMQRSRKPLSR